MIEITYVFSFAKNVMDISEIATKNHSILFYAEFINLTKCYLQIEVFFC